MEIFVSQTPLNMYWNRANYEALYDKNELYKKEEQDYLQDLEYQITNPNFF